MHRQASLRAEFADVERATHDALRAPPRHVRTQAEFDGATPYLEKARGGRIPAARHLEWTHFLDADGRLHSSRAEL